MAAADFSPVEIALATVLAFDIVGGDCHGAADSWTR